MNGYEDDDQRRRVVIRNIRDPHFKRHFRIDRQAVERLVNVVGHHRRAAGLLKYERTPVIDAILMGLWVMFNPDTFRSTGVNLNASMSVIHHHYKVLIRAICGVGQQFVKWPNARQRQQTALFYKRSFRFPRVVGCIDGSLIQITAPAEQKQRYVDRKHNYSINVMIVSDHKRLIRDIYVGEPGSVNDNRLFRRSPFAKCLYSRDDMLSEREHLIGDCGYFLLDKCRATVEWLNSLLKMRMARLKKLYCKNIETTITHICADAVLHNFALLEGEEMEGVVMDGEPPAIDVVRAMQAAQPAGLEKRTFIRAVLDANEDVEE